MLPWFSLHRMQRNHCSSAWSTSSPSLTMVSAGFFHIFSDSSLSHLLHRVFYPFLTMFSYGTTNITDLFNFRQQWVHLAAIWNCLSDARAAPGLFSQKSPLQPPSVSKSCHINPTHRLFCKGEILLGYNNLQWLKQ